MSKVKHYGVNPNDAWLMCSDDPTEGTYVKYEDYETVSKAVIALLTDIRSRYPGQDFTCPHIQLLALLVEGEEQVEDGFKRVEYQGETLDVPEFVNYIATDSSGDRYGYSHKPEVPDWIHAWRTSVSTSDYYFLGVGSSKDWRDSLVQV
ncbi:hypothetical protein MOO17_12410 [Escherichia coli]|uniref:hypothetical protein n=1 Tax=Escherichia coli TaxID=562 RepID=UPI001FF357E9|nr:hypothetical protein [Escherichia coli]MCJ8478825.1 hypothetical protein [Escherichia coli]